MKPVATNRVTAVRSELIGASRDRIAVASYGRRAPICQTSTDTCLAVNRRVDSAGDASRVGAESRADAYVRGFVTAGGPCR